MGGWNAALTIILGAFAILGGFGALGAVLLYARRGQFRERDEIRKSTNDALIDSLHVHKELCDAEIAVRDAELLRHRRHHDRVHYRCKTFEHPSFDA